MSPQSLRRNFFQRLFGIPATPRPQDEGAWEYRDGRVILDLSRIPELQGSGAGIRLEGKGLPARVLVVRGEEETYHAFQNRCRHMGRRVDPVPGAGTVQCCSVSKATYHIDGTVVAGPAKGPLTTYPVEVEDGKLVVRVP